MCWADARYRATGSLEPLTSSHVDRSIYFAPAISVSDTTRYFRFREFCRQLARPGCGEWAAGTRSFLSFYFFFLLQSFSDYVSVFRLKNRFAFESPESDRPVRQWFTRHTAPATSQQTNNKLSNEQDCPSRGDCGGPRARGRVYTPSPTVTTH